jgi:enterochelin esterase-like enzyme
MKHFSYIFRLSGLLFITIVLLFSSTWRCTKKPVVQDKPFVRLLENEAVQSKIFNRSINYAVLLPENYNNSKDSFPVVYLLHGWGDDQKAWYSSGMIKAYSDSYASEIVPMIYVMPQAFETYYINKYDGSLPYNDFFTTELVTEIDSKYRTKKDKNQRAVMGYSMGGFGAIILPLMNPTVFGISVPLSISMRTDAQYISESQSGWNNQWGQYFGGYGLSGTARLTDYYKAHHPLYIFNQTDLTKYSGIRFFIDCGDDEESLDIPNGALHNLMLTKNISHEFRVRNGAHDWDYWHGALHEALVFISNGFSGISYPQNPSPVNTGTLIAPQEYMLSTISDIQVGVFKPASYNPSNIYPVIFFIHDFEGYTRSDNAIKIISLLNNNMVNGSIPNSIIVEIPQSNLLTSSVLTSIINQINTDYKIVGNKSGRVLMGNGLGGAYVCSLISDFTTVFNGCFIYDAKLTSNAVYSTYYYVDLPDKSINYTGNYNLYLALKSSGYNREFRIRQGTSSLQSNLNGINESMSYLSKKLRNQ